MKERIIITETILTKEIEIIAMKSIEEMIDITIKQIIMIKKESQDEEAGLEITTTMIEETKKDQAREVEKETNNYNPRKDLPQIQVNPPRHHSSLIE